MRKKPAIAILTCTAIALMLTGCSPAAATDAETAAVTEEYRATPESEFPAAGICASINEATVRIEIRAWPGNVPDPRCIRVRSEQNLILLNSAPEAITFMLGKYQATIEPGASYTIRPGFGEYLLPGAHSLHIEPYDGPEIYFESPALPSPV